jgi:uroporphyrinogen decarboxylase
MLSRERFHQTMQYDAPDRVPYFEEGLRDDVIQAWHRQGLSQDADISQMFPSDRREEIQPELGPLPELKRWPGTLEELAELEKRLDPNDPARLPSDWKEQLSTLNDADTVCMLRVHRGFFISMGVYEWDRLTDVMFALKQDPEYVKQAMSIWGRFNAAVAERILNEANCDAAIFSEPLGGNDGPLISPKMYEEFVLKSYEPVLEVLHKHRVETIILRTYANSRMMIPSILEYGFNGLWACEVNVETMDYRDLRREFGRDLRLIGGIDLDALRRGRESIREELEEKVPPLIADGGYVPLADGRVREDVPFSDYVYYRQLLKALIS